MVVVGKPVPHWNSRVLREVLAVGLLEAAEEDAVVDAPKYTRRVLHGLLLAEVDVGARKVLSVAAFVPDGDQRGIARPRRALLEDERDVLPVEQVAPDSGRAPRLKLGCEVYQVQHLLVGERREAHHRTALKRIHPSQHGVSPFSVQGSSSPRIFATKSSSDIAPRSPSPLLRTETVPAASSRGPTTSL